RAIHKLSSRKDRVLVKVNCSAIPAGLIESELFGHEKGAFTGALARKIGRFELADGATIFLDEIGDLPLDLQAKLLRVLQEGEFENVIERAIILSQGPQLDLGEWLPKSNVSSSEMSIKTLEEHERAHILAVLDRTGWRVSGEKGAAKLLGLKPTTLEARMKKLGITRKAS